MRLVISAAMSISEALAASGLGCGGFSSIVRLLATGEVRIRDGWSIRPEKMIEPVMSATERGA